MHSPFSAGKWHLGVNCERRGDHCHHPNQHGFSYFFGLPFTLFNDCVPGEGSDILADLQKTLRSLTIFLGIGLLTLVWLIVVAQLCFTGFFVFLSMKTCSQVFIVKKPRKFFIMIKSECLFSNITAHNVHFQVFLRGLVNISLGLLVVLFLVSILATVLWWMPFKFIRTWNCILMKNQEVVEQPMTVETLPQRLLREAQQFIKR